MLNPERPLPADAGQMSAILVALGFRAEARSDTEVALDEEVYVPPDETDELRNAGDADGTWEPVMILLRRDDKGWRNNDDYVIRGIDDLFYSLISRLNLTGDELNQDSATLRSLGYIED